MDSVAAAPWLGVAPEPGRARLFCFPHGGAGSSAYDDWPAGLSDVVQVLAVRPPGRAHRFRERPVSDLVELAGAARTGLTSHLTGRFFLFGHCIGALVAYELAHQLQAAGCPLPAGLLVSGCAAPHLSFDIPISHLDDAEFIRSVRLLGGLTEAQVASPSFIEGTLPALRADCRAAEGYWPGGRPPLGVPIVALGGRADPLVALDRLLAWRRHTAASFEHRLFPGGHFFVRDARLKVLAFLGSWIARAAPRAS